MMNIPPSEARALSLWEYEALLWNWNEAHKTGDDISPPDPEKTQRMIDRINSDPALYLGGVRHKGKKEPMRAGATLP